MMNAWTPGPWEAVDVPGWDVVEVTTIHRVAQHLIPVVRVDVGYEGMIRVEQEANAQLISAAPELANALHIALRKLDTCEQSYRRGGGREFADSIAEVIKRGLAALAKARGDS